MTVFFTKFKDIKKRKKRKDNTSRRKKDFHLNIEKTINILREKLW